MSAAALRIPQVVGIEPTKVFTLEEYLRREERAVHKHEFYNGQIIRMAGGKARHNEIAMNIGTAIKYAVRPLPLKYRVYNSDQKIYLESEKFGVYPDAVVVCEEPEFWQGREDLIVNPLLIVEVASKSTAQYDRKGKFELYRQLPSFKEYILVQQKTPLIESWFRLEPNTWNIDTVKDLSASILLRSLGVSISLSDVYENILFTEKPKK
jgi:Uma2 family endonuclease